MNSDDALQESNEDRDTFADERERCLAFYNVDPAIHAHERYEYVRVCLSTCPKCSYRGWNLQVIGGEVRKSRRDKNR